MSLYHCAECGGQTSVIDTRPSYRRLRRRRKCPNGHRFSTVEIPMDARQQLKDLILWAARQTDAQGDDDLVAYIDGKTDHILFGTLEPDDPDDLTEP